MAMDLKSKKGFSYRGSMYLILTLLVMSLIGGVIIYRHSLLSHIKSNNAVQLDDDIFISIIFIAVATVVVSLFL